MSLKQSMGIPNNADKLGLQAENEPQNPDGVKTETITALAGLKTLVAGTALALTLGATEPARAMDTNAYQLLAANGETMLVKKGQEGTTNPKEIKSILKAAKLSSSFEETVDLMLKKDGELNLSTGVHIMRAEAVNRIEQLVSGGDQIPQSKIYKPLTEENYKQVVGELFDTADIVDWLRNSDGSELTKEQKDKYIATMKYEENRYLKKIDDFMTKFGDKAVNDYKKTQENPGDIPQKKLDEIKKMGGDKAVNDFLNFYNSGAEKLPHKGREFLRRLFVASSSLAFFINTDDNTRTRLMATTATQLGEYLILISNGKITIAKIQIGQSSADTLKYLFPGKKDILDLGIGIYPDLSETALKDLLMNFDNLYKTAKARQEQERDRKKGEQLDEQIAKARQDQERDKQDIAKARQDQERDKQDIAKARQEQERDRKKGEQLDEQIAKARQDQERDRQKGEQLDKQIAKARQDQERDRKFIELGKETRLLATEIENLVNKFINNPKDKVLESNINSLIKKLRIIKERAETELSKTDSKEILGLIVTVEERFIRKFESRQKS